MHPTIDWHAWHLQYQAPGSSLSRRLEVVREQVARVLGERTGRATTLVSLCAGDGRDVLPVLAASGRQVDALLVELDPDLADAARRLADELGLERVEVRAADAGTADTFQDVLPTDVLLLCGIFGNIVDDDVRRTVGALSLLLTPGARVVWTRGDRSDADPSAGAGDPSELVRRVFDEAGLVEEAFVRPTDAGFRVGVHRFEGPRVVGRPGRLFRFVR